MTGPPAEGPAAGVAGREPARERGRLEVYLGFAPGGGKTFAMLREGRDRRDDGEDVVIGYVEPHGRVRTQEAIGNLEVIPRLRVEYRGTTLEEMDLDAVLLRRPHVALVDELAHTNAPGVRYAKRWEDVEQLLGAGIDVITTVNVQHLESVKDMVEAITGITVHETVPDQVLDSADEVSFIDITPEALRKRMRHGNIYPRDRIETALGNFFREGNLAALREIGLRMVADRLAQAEVRGAPEDVLVGVSGSSQSEMLIRRGVRLARRVGGFCSLVHVHDGPPPDDGWRDVARRLLCPVIERRGDVATAIIALARERGVRHVVIGEHAPARPLTRLRSRNVVDVLVEHLTEIDVHVVARYSPLAHQPAPDHRPAPDELLAGLADEQRRGQLRLYLGYAPGCGTTTAMLSEAARRRSRGTDVIVACLSAPHGSDCRELAAALPLLGGHGGAAAEGRLDVEALLTRNPDVACVDDLAGRSTDGRLVADCVPEVLAAGIVLIATLHLTDVRSVVDVVGGHLGRDAGAPVVDDSVLDLADEVELIDVTPEDLVERVRDGLVLEPPAAARALQSAYRPELLRTLRETAFRRLAAHTDRRLVTYMRRKRISEPWEARPRILVCVPPRPGVDDVITRAAATAARRGEELVAVTVRQGHRSDEEKHFLGEYTTLVDRTGGEFVTLEGTDVAATIARFARQRLITEVIAMRGRDRRARTLRRLVRMLADTDLHILAV